MEFIILLAALGSLILGVDLLRRFSQHDKGRGALGCAGAFLLAAALFLFFVYAVVYKADKLF